MAFAKRKFGYGIWGLGLGYFIFYTPYSGLTKALSKGLLPGMRTPMPGLEILPLSAVTTLVSMYLFISLVGWWKHARRTRLVGFRVPAPGRATFVSGLCMAAIIATTTLAFSFSGTSIVFVLVLLRGGVLIIGPIIDCFMGRRVRWFSWAGSGISLIAVLVLLYGQADYRMSLAAVVNIAVYLGAYVIRFALMTRLAKTTDRATTLKYFVEEQMVAAPAMVLGLAAVALVGGGAQVAALRQGFFHLSGAGEITAVAFVGVFYTALCLCTSFIFLDGRENTFCIPMHCGSSLLSGIAAAGILALSYNQPPSHGVELASAALIMVALSFLSPLHHAKDIVYEWSARSRLRALGLVASGAERVLDAASTRISASAARPPKTHGLMASPATQTGSVAHMIILFVCGGNTCRSAIAEAVANAHLALRFGLEAVSGKSRAPIAVSAGITARPGAPMKPQAVRALRSMGLQGHRHRSRLVSANILQEADVVFCMSEAQREELIRMCPDASAKTHLLDPDADLEEPGGAELEPYLNCAEMIRRLVTDRLSKLYPASASVAVEPA